MQKIVTFLWFDNQAEEAANLYVSIFKNSKILSVSRYGKVGPRPEGSVMTVTFQLEGQEFCALNGGPHFKFTRAISLFVNCESQEEVDQLWDKLSAGGREDRCGWLQDKYGLSWQIIPTTLMKLMGDPDPESRTGYESHAADVEDRCGHFAAGLSTRVDRVVRRDWFSRSQPRNGRM